MALFQPGRRGFINRSVSFSRPRDYQTSGLTKKTRANLFRRFRRGLGYPRLCPKEGPSDLREQEPPPEFQAKAFSSFC
jgi:hypothetical protein